MHAHALYPLLEEQFTEAIYTGAGMLPSRPPSGFGFFPVCEGVWDLPKNLPHKRLLFLGQDFGDQDQVLPIGETNRVKTWMHLEELLQDARADARHCFFSNLVMGVRPAGKQTGPAPGLASLTYRKRCADFLRVQVSVIQPEAIVVLGLEALPVLRLGTQTIPHVDNFRDWDIATRRRAISVQVGDWTGPLILLVHPCYRHLNTKIRSADTPATAVSGHQFEVKLLQSVM